MRPVTDEGDLERFSRVLLEVVAGWLEAAGPVWSAGELAPGAPLECYGPR